MTVSGTPAPVTALLDELVRSYPDRAQEVRRLLAGSGLTDAEIARHLSAKVSRAAAATSSVPTLVDGVSRPMTAMLAQRFAFAGTVQDLVRLLDLREMATVPGRAAFRRAFEAQSLHWAGSAAAVVPGERLSILSVRSLDDGDLAYLVWPERDGPEPAVWEYAGQSESRFDDLAAYLRHLLR